MMAFGDNLTIVAIGFVGLLTILVVFDYIAQHYGWE